MTDEEIRKRYERTKETAGELGENTIAISRIINMLHTHGRSDNINVRRIIENLEHIEDIAPNFKIFQSEKETFFMNNFNALQILDKEENSSLSLPHEFGHAIIGITTNTEVPKNFEIIVKNARANCIKPENKQKFIEFIEYISDTENENRTEGEKGPVSDIISSIFQYPQLTFVQTGKTHTLPNFHNRDYYFDEEKGKMKENKIYNEDFANFYALTANNCHKELETLRELLGDEWMKVMEGELQRASEIFEKTKENTQELNIVDRIKDSIIGVKKGEVPKEIILKKEKENDTPKLDEEILK